MVDGTLLNKLDEIQKLLKTELSGSKNIQFSGNAINGSEPVTVQPSTTTNIEPGEAQEVVTLDIRKKPNKVFLLSEIGTNDIPDSNYTVITDGNNWGTTPAPLGTVAKPFNTLEELGGYIIVRKQVSLVVKRNSDAGSSEDWSGIITGREVTL